MNSYELTLTTPSRWRVYRFHHLGINWQEWEDSNPRPAVLETAALPTELHSYFNKIYYHKSWRKLSGTPGATRTPDTRFRKPLLYPPELQGRNLVEIGGIRITDLCDADADALPPELYPQAAVKL